MLIFLSAHLVGGEAVGGGGGGGGTGRMGRVVAKLLVLRLQGADGPAITFAICLEVGHGGIEAGVLLGQGPDDCEQIGRDVGHDLDSRGGRFQVVESGIQRMGRFTLFGMSLHFIQLCREERTDAEEQQSTKNVNTNDVHDLRLPLCFACYVRLAHFCAAPVANGSPHSVRQKQAVG